MLTLTPRNRFFVILIICVASSPFCQECSKREEKISENPVIAIVNGEQITLDELEMEKKFMLFPNIQRPVSSETTDIVNKNILGKLIDRKILLQEAQKRNITVSKEEVEKEINSIKSNYPENTFYQFFKENNIPFELWKQNLSELLTIQKLLSSVTDNNPRVTEEEIYLYYKAHPEEFKNINKIMLRQILVQDAKIAEEIRRRLNSGDDFIKLVEEFSIGYEKKNGGLLPFLSSNELPEQLEGVFQKNIGEIYGPVKTDYGYHIVRVEKKMIKKKVELKDTKNAIIEILKREKINNSLKTFLSTLRKNSRIEIIAPELLFQGKT